MISSTLRFVFRAALLIAFMLIPLFPSLMRINYHRKRGDEAGMRKADEVSVQLARRLIWFFGLRIDVSGEPLHGAVLMAANHISWLDILVLQGTHSVGFVAKAEIDSWPLFGYMSRTGGTIFHQRGSHDSAADVSALMAQRLSEGRAVAIFPEGGIKPGSSIRVFHARMFKAAVDVGCPVQPVMIRYMRDGQTDTGVCFRKGESMMWNLARMLAKPAGSADLHFLPGIDATDKPRRYLAETAREAVVSSYGSVE